MILTTLKNKNLVSKQEIKKIKQQSPDSNKTLNKLYRVIKFLVSKKLKKFL